MVSALWNFTKSASHIASTAEPPAPSHHLPERPLQAAGHGGLTLSHDLPVAEKSQQSQEKVVNFTKIVPKIGLYHAIPRTIIIHHPCFAGKLLGEPHGNLWSPKAAKLLKHLLRFAALHAAEYHTAVVFHQGSSGSSRGSSE